MYNAWLRMGGSCDTAMSLLTNMGESNMNNDGRLTPLGARLVDRFLDSLSFLRLCPSLVGVFLIDDSGRRLSWVDEEGILGMVLEKSVIINEMGEDQEEEEVVTHNVFCVVKGARARRRPRLFRLGGSRSRDTKPRLVIAN